jgi:hypothetical protein
MKKTIENVLCAKTELCLFEPLAYQNVITTASWCDIHPTSSIDRTGVIEFMVQNTNDYLDMNDTILQVNACVVGKDGKSISKDTTTVSTTNYLLHTLFEDVIVHLNDVKIEGGNSLYPFKAVIQNDLNFSRATKKIQLTPAGYEPDVQTRQKLYCTGDVFQLTGCLNVDFFQTQPKYLLPGVNLRILLKRNKNQFSLLVSGSALQPQIQILDAVLYVRKVQCAAPVLLGHEIGLRHGNARYPFQKTELVTQTIGAGLQSYIRENIFGSFIPKFMVIVFINGQAFNGDYKKDPLEFSHFYLNYLSVFVDGQAIPYRTGYTPNFVENIYTKDYFISLIQNVEHMRRNTSNGISMEEFANGGKSYFTFNLTPDFSVNQSQAPKAANMRLEIKFARPLAESINVLAMGIFDSLIQITQDRKIIK